MAKHGAKVVVNDLGAHFDGTGAPTGTPGAGGRSRDQEDGRRGRRQRRQRQPTSRRAKRIVECAIDTFGKLNIVVNNAGILRDRMIFNMAEEDWDAVVAVHLKGTFNMARHACEYWREEHKKGNLLNGRIINTASDAGLLGNVGQINYGAGKAAVAAMAIIIGQRDEEVRRHRQRHRAGRAHAPHGRRDAVDRGAHGRRGRRRASSTCSTPRNIAPLVAWLASDDAASVQRRGLPRRRRQRVADEGLALGDPHQEREAGHLGRRRSSARASRKSWPRASPRARTWATSSPEGSEVTAAPAAAARGGFSSSVTRTPAAASSPRRCCSGCSREHGLDGSVVGRAPGGIAPFARDGSLVSWTPASCCGDRHSRSARSPAPPT